MTMRADEVAEVTVRADFGYQTLDAVADAVKGQRLILRLELVDFTTERTPWDSEDAEELLGMAEARKAAGNEQFKRGDVPRAFQHYKRATHATGVILLSFDHERTKEGDEAEEKITIHAADGPKRRARRLECSVKANMAACHAHYRLGIAYEHFHDQWDLAALEFKKCLEDDPKNRDAAARLARVEKKIKGQNSKDRKRAGFMFSAAGIKCGSLKVSLTSTLQSSAAIESAAAVDRAVETRPELCGAIESAAAVDRAVETRPELCGATVSAAAVETRRMLRAQLCYVASMSAAALSAAPQRVLCYGDSLTAGTSPPLDEDYPTRRCSRPHWIVRPRRHRGLPGRDAAGMLDALDDEQRGLRALLKRAEPALCVILAGTNDLSYEPDAATIASSVVGLHELAHGLGVPTASSSASSSTVARAAPSAQTIKS
ncbi:FK506 binding protein [Aureococcus anophagefferens]|nr:FK506 binding protein [Aureococcus anophagefferens]